MTKIGYGSDEKTIARFVWGAWLKLELPPVPNTEVMAAVRATRRDDVSDYENMKCAMRALGWTR